MQRFPVCIFRIHNKSMYLAADVSVVMEIHYKQHLDCTDPFIVQSQPNISFIHLYYAFFNVIWNRVNTLYKLFIKDSMQTWICPLEASLPKIAIKLFLILDAGRYDSLSFNL